MAPVDSSATSSGEPIAATLGRFAASLRYDDLPAEVVAAAKALILDQLACELIGSTLPWVEPAIALTALSQGVVGESTVVNHGSRYLAADTAFLNATFGQACELDDSAHGSAGHIGTATVPVALAVGEREGINGRRFVAAIVAGYEVMYRLALSINPHHVTRGFHTQGIAGPFAGAAVTGNIIGLTDNQMVHALAIAGSHAIGPLEYDQSGGEVKRIHAGIAARGGVHSALLAKFGLTGPPTIVEGKRGFCNVFAEASDPSLITPNLGQSFNISNAAFKMYPTVGSLHTSIEAVRRAAVEHDIKPEEVDRIRVGMAEYALLHGAGIGRPQDVIGAQFSLGFSLALALIKRNNDLDHYRNPALWNDPQIVSIIEKVETYRHPDAQGGGSPAFLRIELKDGRTIEVVQKHRKGTPQNPATGEERDQKVRSLAGSVLSTDRVDRLIEAVEAIEDLPHVGDLAKLLVAER